MTAIQIVLAAIDPGLQPPSGDRFHYPIQIVLVVCSVMALAAYFVFLRSVLRDRLIAVVIALLAIVAIMFPDMTNKAANLVGVGRGADLLLYMVAMSGVFAVLIIITRMSALERAVTELGRELAIRDARPPQAES